MKVLTPGAVASVVAGLALALVAAIWLGLASGPAPIPFREVAAALFGGAVAPSVSDIVFGIRLPRVVLAMLVGACLAVSGVFFQALLRNPLADPFVLGVSGGAALGAVAVLSLGSAVGLGPAAVPPAAFAGCAATTLLLYGVSGAHGRLSPTHLLLTGVVFNAFASAAIVFVASLSGRNEGADIFLWLIGSLSANRADVLWWVALFLAAGLAFGLPMARNLNLLALGEESAQQLGVNVERDKRIALFATSLMVGAAVSVSGLIGFVGLIIPHFLRLVLGSDHRLLLPAAALGGALFLLLCDTVARSLLDGRELPVGAITALAGGPLFLWLLRRSRNQVFPT